MNTLIVLGHNRLTGVNTWAHTLAKELESDIAIFDVPILEPIDGDLFVNKVRETTLIHTDGLPNKRYDVVILNYNYHETLFSLYNTIFVSHGAMNDYYKPKLRHNFHVGVSEVVTDFFKANSTILNGIDLEEFRPLKPCPKTPQKILYISRAIIPKELEIICDELDMTLTHAYNADITAEFISKFDFVIGYGRSAYEAMACGKPVLIYGPAYSDGWVKKDTFKQMLNRNCSGWEFKYEFNPGELMKQITQYNPADGYVNRKLAEEFLSSKIMAEKFRNLLEKI